MKKNENGCPCSSDCCDDPNIVTPDHECSDEDVCEDCYVSECENCGDSCCCDL